MNLMAKEIRTKGKISFPRARCRLNDVDVAPLLSRHLLSPVDIPDTANRESQDW